jgi:transposase-like protein
MAKKTKHSKAQIARKLAEANDLAEQGKSQSEIARTLGVSVMTLYRWRKAPPGAQPERHDPASLAEAAAAAERFGPQSDTANTNCRT